MHDGQLLVVRGVVDEDLQHEAIDLGLRQGIRPLGLDRILGCHHEERVGNRVRRVTDRHLVLLHHLEQRGLHLRRCAVDLVREQEVREHGTEVGVERARVRPVDPRADEVRRHEVGRELDAVEGTAEDIGGGLDGQGLGETGNALDQQVAAGEEARQDSLQHLVLSGDHAPDLEEGSLQHLLRLLRLGCGRLLGLLGHASSFRHRVLQ